MPRAGARGQSEGVRRKAGLTQTFAPSTFVNEADFSYLPDMRLNLETERDAMAEFHDDLSETHIMGDSVLRSVTAQQCPALAIREISHVGFGDARAPYRVVRMDLAGAYLHGSISGQGRVLLDGHWQVHSQKMTSFAPAHVLHAFHAVPQVPWRICWVRYTPKSLRSMPGTMAPVLATFDPGPLGQAIAGLYSETVEGENNPGTCALWVDLIENYVARFTDPWRQDKRLSRVWAAVQNDLQHDWTLKEFAGLAGISSEHFRRLCHKNLGRSPFRQLVDLRIQQASHLLTITDATIESVANAVGYDNPFAFSNVFLKIMGSRPSSFRKAAKDRLTS
jgi:AraC-like DNA-binding protein